MELYFGTKKVNPKEQIGARNTTLPIRIRTLEPRPRQYVFLIIDLTRNELKYIDGLASREGMPYGSKFGLRVTDAKYGSNYPFKDGKHGVYYFSNPPPVKTKEGFTLDIQNFTSAYPLVNFGKLEAKYGFFVVPTIATTERFSLLFPNYLSIDIQRMIVNNDSFSGYDIQEICAIASNNKDVTLCNDKFYQQLAKERLNKSEKYWKENPMDSAKKQQLIIDAESMPLQRILELLAINYPIVVRKLLYISNANIIEQFAKYLPIYNEYVPMWAYEKYYQRPFAGFAETIVSINTLLEAVFPSNDGEGTYDDTGIDTTRFNINSKSFVAETNRIWDWIVEHLSDKDFNEGLEWLATRALSLPLLEKFLQYLSPEDQEIYLERYRQLPHMIGQADISTPVGLAIYLSFGFNIDDETLREHGLVPLDEQ